MTPNKKTTVVITGCSDGSMGSALAIAFHSAGWRVLATARNTSKLDNVKALGIDTAQMDVTSDESIAQSVATVSNWAGGSLDALVNGAGGVYAMPLLDLDISKAHDVLELNAFSLIRVTRAFFPLLSKSSHKGGALVANITSISSVTAGTLPFQGAYDASKAAATSITESMRHELAPFNIKVVNLISGAVRTNLWKNAPTPVLPSDSLYNAAKEPIELSMSGANTGANGVDASAWAAQVVKDLEKSKLPYWLWRGAYAWETWFASFFPVGTFDSIIKGKAGIDVLEKKLQEQKS